MPFRIHTQSPELKRELERKLAGLESQLDGDFEYEISAEVLPAEQALERASSVAAELGADAIFVAAGTFATQEVEIPQPVHEEPVAAEPESQPSLIQTSSEERRATSFDTEKIRRAVAETSAQARDLSAKLGSRAGSLMKTCGSASAHALSRSRKWASAKGADAKTVSGELRKRLAEKAEQSRQRAAEWNARRLERQAAESKLRAERERAAHREAELAAAAAHIMHREQKKKEAEQTATPQNASLVPATPACEPNRERDTWPIWRNAFAAAACLAMVGIFLLAASGNQSNASPATSSENATPALPAALALPPVVKVAPQRKPVAEKSVAAPESAKFAKPSPPKRIARAEDEGFQEVTVRHYPDAARTATPKKDAKGVVQISDME